MAAQRILSHHSCTIWVLAAGLIALPGAAAAADQQCLGLACGDPGSPRHVPEAHGDVPALDNLDDLNAQANSGFYEVPAPVYQGDHQPRTIVYLSKPGQLDRMPPSVRGLRVVREHASFSELDRATLIVVDDGLMRIVLSDISAARGQAQARASQSWYGCFSFYFCLYTETSWGGSVDPWHGPTFYGTGWWTYTSAWNNSADSMVNYRDGDTLLADDAGGAGTRYCARQQSDDSTFANNSIGNNQVSSVALLASTPDRC